MLKTHNPLRVFSHIRDDCKLSHIHR